MFFPKNDKYHGHKEYGLVLEDSGDTENNDPPEIFILGKKHARQNNEKSMDNVTLSPIP
jgi:hypothetical protein